jgi:hypothetical protein
MFPGCGPREVGRGVWLGGTRPYRAAKLDPKVRPRLFAGRGLGVVVDWARAKLRPKGLARAYKDSTWNALRIHGLEERRNVSTTQICGPALDSRCVVLGIARRHWFPESLFVFPVTQRGTQFAPLSANPSATVKPGYVAANTPATTKGRTEPKALALQPHPNCW